jgi:hypothetical protein
MARVERARFTNDLHLQLFVILDQVMDVAEDGMDDNLDAECVGIFQRAFDQAEILQQSIKAELEAHMKSSQWG